MLKYLKEYLLGQPITFIDDNISNINDAKRYLADDKIIHYTKNLNCESPQMDLNDV